MRREWTSPSCLTVQKGHPHRVRSYVALTAEKLLPEVMVCGKRMEGVDQPNSYCRYLSLSL